MKTISLKKFTTHCDITVYDDINSNEEAQLTSEVDQLINSFEQEFSRFLPTSTLSHLNRWEKVTLSRSFIDLLARTQEVTTQINWAFHPFVSVRSVGYGTSFDKNFVPTQLPTEKTHETLSLDLSKYISLDSATSIASLQPWYFLDLWWIGKWYLVDLLKTFLQNKWYRNFIINFWWDIVVQGEKLDHSPFVIAIDNPHAPWEDFGFIEIREWSVSTSWSFKRRWEVDGKPYHHIINPTTWTNSREIVSATIVGPTTTLTDCFATAVMAGDVHAGITLLKNNNLDGLLITQNEEVITTEWFTQKYNLL